MAESAVRWRAVGRMLAFGAAFDAAFGVGILAFTRPAARTLRIEVPADPVYLYLNGVLLLLLAGLYAAASREPQRYAAVAPVSAAGRVLGFALFVWAWSGGRPMTFLGLGLADLGVAVATAAAWWRASRRPSLSD